MKKVILAITVLILVSSSVYWQMNKPVDEEVIKNTNQSVLDGWSTYRNEELGIEFKYYEDWLFEENYDMDGNVIYTGCYYLENRDSSNPTASKITPKVSIEVLENPQNLDAVDIVEQYNNLGHGSLDELLIDSLDIDGKTLQVYNLPGFVVYPTIIFNHIDFTYQIKCNLEDTEFDYFINSLRFIN